MERKNQLMIGAGVLVGLVGIYFGWTYYLKRKTPENVKLEVNEVEEKEK